MAPVLGKSQRREVYDRVLPKVKRGRHPLAFVASIKNLVVASPQGRRQHMAREPVLRIRHGSIMPESPVARRFQLGGRNRVGNAVECRYHGGGGQDHAVLGAPGAAFAG